MRDTTPETAVLAHHRSVAAKTLAAEVRSGHYAFVVDESSGLRVRHAVAADGAAIAE